MKAHVLSERLDNRGEGRMRLALLLLLVAGCDVPLCDPVSGRCKCPDYHVDEGRCVCRDPKDPECHGYRSYFDAPLACESTSERVLVVWNVAKHCVCSTGTRCTGTRYYGEHYLPCETTSEGITPACF